MVAKPKLPNNLLDEDTDFNTDISPKLEEEDKEDEQDEPNSFKYDPEKINIVTREPTIEQLLRRVKEEVLDLAPDFQRHADLWNNDTKSRLIESIIIRIPLPSFYIDATREEKWFIVDGLQRLTALKQFVSDKTLKLSGLEYLKELNEKSYEQIGRKYQRRIEETQVTVYLIEKGTPAEVKLNIFRRINTGGLPLSNQELRHALNPGKVIKLLAKLAKSQVFRQVTQLSKTRTKRMDDREFVLGFLAFKLISYETYNKYITRDAFLNEAMARINKISDAEVENLENEFIKAMIHAWEIFDNNAFRKTYLSYETRRHPVNKALFEAWSVCLSNLSDADIKLLKERKKDLIDRFSNCVETDITFNESISQAAKQIPYRFSTIERLINQVLS